MMSSVCSPAAGHGVPAARLHSSPHHRSTSSSRAFVELKFASLNHPSVGIGCGKPFRIRCAEAETAAGTIDLTGDFEEPKLDDNGGGGGHGGSGGLPNGGGGGGEGDEGDGDEEEFGPIMKYGEVLIEAERRGAVLPADMLGAAKTTGLRKLILSRYLDFQGSAWPLGFLMRYCRMLRNRMVADPSFLFKVGTEVAIGSCCATFAEVKKRGKDFRAEFELYAADLLVGIVVDIALVGMLAPYARIGKSSVSSGFLGYVQHACEALPSSVFEAERPGIRFSTRQRIATYFYKEHQEVRRGHTCSALN